MRNVKRMILKILTTYWEYMVDSQESQEIFHDEKHGKHESDRNSSYEEVFDEISTKSFDTSTTKDDTITKK